MDLLELRFLAKSCAKKVDKTLDLKGPRKKESRSHALQAANDR